MENLTVIESYLDDELKINQISDACSNGLEVGGKEIVKKIIFMVDASEEGFKLAVDKQADMIIVHHGLFFGNIKKINGNLYKRIKVLIDNEISLYAAHLPLDIHCQFGNNVQIAGILGLHNIRQISVGGYTDLLVIGELDHETDIEIFLNLIKEKINPDSRILSFGNNTVKKIGIISGSGSEAIEVSAQLGADLFLTGEPKLAAYHNAKESEINIVFAGHYYTEVFGLRSLMNHIVNKFQVTAEFIDIPTFI